MSETVRNTFLLTAEISALIHNLSNLADGSLPILSFCWQTIGPDTAEDKPSEVLPEFCIHLLCMYYNVWEIEQLHQYQTVSASFIFFESPILLFTWSKCILKFCVTLVRSSRKACSSITCYCDRWVQQPFVDNVSSFPWLNFVIWSSAFCIYLEPFLMACISKQF